MSTQKRYLAYLVLAFVPSLSGCLWKSILVDGKLEATTAIEEPSSESSEEGKTEKEIEK
jgi:hypothetical protein